ncbi:MAG: hypothetical protein JWN98_422 [Abditibacteriota bacterium]|nr:hypothetical protein [Abditibacteriota bacterium]
MRFTLPIDLNWDILGVEFDAEGIKTVTTRTGGTGATAPAELGTQTRAAVLPLRDVLEHLTQMNEQMPQILRLLKPGGVLLTQGPLENNASLFTSVLGTVCWTAQVPRPLRGSEQITEFVPCHVMPATAKGQRLLCERFGLVEEKFSRSEVG